MIFYVLYCEFRPRIVKQTNGSDLISQSRYFELFWPHTKLHLNGRKPENNSLIRLKNTKEIMINHKGTRMAKDGED